MARKPGGSWERQVHRRCPACAGEGVVEQPSAPGGNPSPAAGLPTAEEIWPEGQAVERELAELALCPACNGRGRVTVRLNAEEYRVWRRRRLLRGIALLAVGLIPFLLLYATILAQPEMICGRPWYGIGFILLFLWQAPSPRKFDSRPPPVLYYGQPNSDDDTEPSKRVRSGREPAVAASRQAPG